MYHLHLCALVNELTNREHCPFSFLSDTVGANRLSCFEIYLTRVNYAPPKRFLTANFHFSDLC